MKISLISTSHRESSQSNRVMKILSNRLEIKHKYIKTFNFDFYEESPPLWSSKKKG